MQFYAVLLSLDYLKTLRFSLPKIIKLNPCNANYEIENMYRVSIEL